LTAGPTVLTPSDAPAPGTFEAIFRALDASSRPVLGPARPRLLVIPIHGIAYALTVRDNRFVDIILVRFGKCPVTRNHRFWGGDSYKP